MFRDKIYAIFFFNLCDLLPESFPSLYMFSNYQRSKIKLNKKSEGS